MMRCSDLPWLIQFIVMFYNDKPGDWLLDGMMETKACNLEKDLVSDIFLFWKYMKNNNYPLIIVVFQLISGSETISLK